MKSDVKGHSSLSPSIVLILLIAFCPRGDWANKCELQLMRSFFLNGMEESIHTDMSVCPYVKNRCCSLYDEIKIAHLWMTRSQSLLQRHKDSCFLNVKTLINYFDRIAKIDPLHIMVKYSVFRSQDIPYRHCERSIGVINEREIQTVRRYYAQSKTEVAPERPAPQLNNTFINRNPTGWNPFT